MPDRSLNRQLFETKSALYIRDVTLHETDDLQLHRAKLARILLDEMYQFVGLLDAAGTLIDANRNALEGAGIDLQKTLGLPFWEARWWQVSETIQEGVRDSIRRAAAGEFVRYDVEIFGDAAGEDTIIIDYSLVPIRDRAGEVVMLLAEGRNITEKKRAEEEIARKNRELERLLERLRELDEIKTQFFANVSHELRTPLALVLGPVERILADGTPDERMRRDLEVVRSNASVLLKQVNDLLDISKLDAGEMAPDYVETDVAALVRQVAANFEALAPQRQIAIAIEVPDSLPAELDADKVRRILLNLFSNALKFAPVGGRVTCSAVLDANGRVVIEVADNGPGVPVDQRSVVFERFRQVDAGASRQRGGTGLGLAIARDFAELHGGTIGVSEAPGGGALFRVELPRTAPVGARVRRARAAEPARAELLGGGDVTRGVLDQMRIELATTAPASDDDASAPAEAPADAPSVLVVEDNPDLRAFVADTLRTRFRVTTAADGEEGLETARAIVPDLVVTDIMMPRKDGAELARAIREDAALHDIPILVLSARADDALRLELLRERVQDYLVKPFSSDELVARVANLTSVKRAGDLLRTQIDSQQRDLESLAREVADRNEALADAADTMRLSLDRAEAASRAKSEFMRLVSHELRNPLTSVVIHTDRLRRALGSGAGERVEGLIGSLDGATERLVDIVEAVLEHTRLAPGHTAPAIVPVALAELGREVLEPFRAAAERKGLALTCRVEASGPAPGDPGLLRLVLKHLLENAVKFTETGGVDVLLGFDGRECRIVVADTGPGIAPEDRARIFEPFEEAGSVRNKHEPGMGLGLAIVRHAAESMNGTIEVTSVPGEGSRFAFAYRPRADARAA